MACAGVCRMAPEIMRSEPYNEKADGALCCAALTRTATRST